jgi:hypothetical protein
LSKKYTLNIKEQKNSSLEEGRRSVMCIHKNTGCRIQDKLKGKPEECSSEQIRECHGTEIHHPCVEIKKEQNKK